MFFKTRSFKEKAREIYEEARLDMAFFMVLCFGILFGEVELGPWATLILGVGGTIVVGVLYGFMVIRPPRAKDPRDTVLYAVKEMEAYAWRRGTTLKALTIEVDDEGSYMMQTYFSDFSEKMAEELGIDEEDYDE